MIEKETRIEGARWVEGDLGVHFVYTAGLAGEEFLRGLAKGKILASTCDKCERTYCPPRIFCEDCFAEVADRHEVAGAGTLRSLARVPGPGAGEWVGAIQLDGTDGTVLHRVEGEGLAIGARVEVVWATKRSGSILDIRHFKAVPGAAPKARPAVAEANGEAASRPRRVVRAE